MASVLRELIRALIIEDKELGDIAFGASRYHQGTIDRLEPDTTDEHLLARALQAHIIDDESLSSDQRDLLHDIILSGEYSDVFREPKQTILYRGLTFETGFQSKKCVDFFESVDINADLVKNTFFENVDVNVKVGNVNDRTTTSWTPDRRVAGDFANSVLNCGISVVLTAFTEHNQKTFLSLEPLYKILSCDGEKSENEILALRPVFVSKITWTNHDV